MFGWVGTQYPYPDRFEKLVPVGYIGLNLRILLELMSFRSSVVDTVSDSSELVVMVEQTWLEWGPDRIHFAVEDQVSPSVIGYALEAALWFYFCRLKAKKSYNNRYSIVPGGWLGR